MKKVNEMDTDNSSKCQFKASAEPCRQHEWCRICNMCETHCLKHVQMDPLVLAANQGPAVGK